MRNRFRIGDRILVVGPNETGLHGVVEEIESNHQVYVYLDREPKRLVGFLPGSLRVLTGLDTMLKVAFESDSSDNR